MNHSALLIIDIINDFSFASGDILAQKTSNIAENIALLKKQCRTLGIPIIYINDHYQLWKADIAAITKHCTNEKSKPILAKLPIEHDDFFLIKPHYSAFYETPLESLLQTLHIKHLIITGIAGNICVLFTANDAYMRKYQLTIPCDCIASNSDEDNDYALQMIKELLKANIAPSFQLLQQNQ